jgi:hypothetical protein
MHGLRIKKFIARYAWAGTIAGFVFGFLFGPGIIWQMADFRLKSRSATFEQAKVKKEFYESLQVIRDEITSELPKYIDLRDKYNNRKPLDYQIQNDFKIEQLKISSLYGEYNRLETMVCNLENRPPQLVNIDFETPPSAPINLNVNK